MVTLPTRLDWSPGERRYDLADPDDRAWLYARVVREAATVADLAAYLNTDFLTELLPALPLPARARAEWEQRFPELAGR